MIAVDLNKKIIKKSEGTDLQTAYSDAKYLWYRSRLLIQYPFPFWVTETEHEEHSVDDDGTVHQTIRREYQIHPTNDWTVQ